MAVIAIVTSAPPLTEGGHLVIARSLERALKEAGHRAGIVTTPSNRFGRQGAAYLANWLTDVGTTGGGERVDQIISLRFPSYAVRHPKHVCWLVHTMREYYDLWDRFSSGLSPQGRVKETMRRTLVRAVDSYCFKRRVQRLFTISGGVRDRVRRWNGVDATVLHPPPPQRQYRCEEYGDFLLVISRLSPLKRVDLVLRALAQAAAAGARCVIAGEGEAEGQLRELSSALGLNDRVTFAGRLDDDELAMYLARCRAVVFTPYDEDYGFVTVEAFASSKPVITCSDSGGPLELVRAGLNGWVVAPDPSDIAVAIAAAMGDRETARRYGQAGRAGIAELEWSRVVSQLVIV